MVRKAILLTPEESARLKALAKAQGVSEAEILRAAVARQIADTSQEPPDDDWKARLMACAGTITDPDFGARVLAQRARWRARLARKAEDGD